MSAVVCFVDNCGRGESHPSHHERSAQNVLRAFRSGVAPSGAKLRLLQTGMWTCSAEDWGTPVVLPDSARFSGFTALLLHVRAHWEKRAQTNPPRIVQA